MCIERTVLPLKCKSEFCSSLAQQSIGMTGKQDHFLTVKLTDVILSESKNLYRKDKRRNR